MTELNNLFSGIEQSGQPYTVMAHNTAASLEDDVSSTEERPSSEPGCSKGEVYIITWHYGAVHKLRHAN